METVKKISALHILNNLHNGIEVTLSNNKRELTRDSLLVRSVGEALQIGLKEPKNGFWHIIRDITHSTTRATIARALRHVYDNYDRGLFWIYFTIIEGSLESYMNVLVNESGALKRFYWEDSIVRDLFLSEKFLQTLSLLSDITLTPVDSFFEKGLKLEFGDSFGSSKRSLSSPEDSGIAFLESDASSLSDKTEDNPELDFRNDWLDRKISYSISSLNNLKFEELINNRKESFEDCHLSGVSPDSVVIRRKKKKDDGKRVSFHEDVEEKEMKKSIRDRSPKERYSLPEDFNYKSFLMELFTPASIKMEEKGSEALELNVEERGAPEGQEDPSSEFANEAPLEVTFRARKPGKELRERVLRKSLTEEMMKHAMSKSSLVNKFLNSIPETAKVQKRSLYLGPKPIIPSLNKEIEEALRNELTESEPLSSKEEQVLVNGLRDVLCCDPIYKVFKVSNLEGESLLGVVTRSKVFLLGALGGISGVKKSFDLQDVDTVICGPKNEILFLILRNKAFSVLVPWFGNGSDVCGALHMASLSLNKTHCSINFVPLSLCQMESLSRAIRKSVGCKETLLDYFWVRGEETMTEMTRSKESHLMVSLRKPFKWLPAKVSLKGCSLSLLREGYEPMHYNIKTCTACDRLATNRPHTFLLKFNKSQPLVIATPDDYQMSEWMQAILSASLKGRESPKGSAQLESFGLIITDNFLIKTKFPDTFVKSTRLTDISSIRVRSAHCIVELDCHEVRETNGDWILYFSSAERRQEFVERLVQVRPSLEKVVASLTLEASPWEVKEKQILASFANLILSYS